MAVMSGSSHNSEYPSYVPPGPNDLRSTCPALNSMANHGILPRDGRNITSRLLVNTTIQTYGTTTTLAWISSLIPRVLPHILTSKTFNLDDLSRAKTIRHDGLLSRPDLGTTKDENKPDNETWSKVMSIYLEPHDNDVDTSSTTTHQLQAAHTTLQTLAKARQSRIHDSICTKGNKTHYNSLLYLVSYGETAVTALTFGDANGKVPVKYLDAWFREERIPYDEGWTPRLVPVSVWSVLVMMGRLIGVTGVDDTVPWFLGVLGFGRGKGRKVV